MTIRRLIEKLQDYNQDMEVTNIDRDDLELLLDNDSEDDTGEFLVLS